MDIKDIEKSKEELEKKISELMSKFILENNINITNAITTPINIEFPNGEKSFIKCKTVVNIEL